MGGRSAGVMRPLTLYVCPACDRTADSRDFDRVECAGAVSDGTAHAPVMTEPVRVFREEDVRALWHALDAVHDHRNDYPTDLSPGRDYERAMSAAYLALEAFPAPEEWRAGS